MLLLCKLLLLSPPGDANTKVAFKNCAPFKERRTELNETFADNAENTNIAMHMYNLIKYMIIMLTHLAVYGNLKDMKKC